MELTDFRKLLLNSTNETKSTTDLALLLEYLYSLYSVDMFRYRILPDDTKPFLFGVPLDEIDRVKWKLNESKARQKLEIISKLLTGVRFCAAFYYICQI